MRYFLLFTLITPTQNLFSQAFLKAFKDYRTTIITNDNQPGSSPNSNGASSNGINKKSIEQSKKRRVAYLSQQIIQFDAVFRQYKRLTGFDFNEADSLTILYQTSVESSLSDYLVYSGRDTIAFGEEWKMVTLHFSSRQIIYKPFFDSIKPINGVKVIRERDSLVTIATLSSCGIALFMAKQNKVLDGSTSTIIKATKSNGQYFIEECFLPPFGFAPIFRKK